MKHIHFDFHPWLLAHCSCNSYSLGLLRYRIMVGYSQPPKQTPENSLSSFLPHFLVPLLLPSSFALSFFCHFTWLFLSPRQIRETRISIWQGRPQSLKIYPKLILLFLKQIIKTVSSSLCNSWSLDPFHIRRTCPRPMGKKHWRIWTDRPS